MEKKKIFLMLGFFWLAIMLGFIGIKEYTLRNGEDIMLKTMPVDPRDLFRGDYVILRYEINSLAAGNLEGGLNKFNKGDKLYILLKKEGGYAVPTKISASAPKEGLYIKGTVKDYQNGKIEVEYGIESYFVPQGKGYIVEQNSGKNLDVIISVDKFGNSIIKKLLINGKEADFGD